MTMPAPESAPPPYYPPQKRGNGCLWGCLILMLLLFIPPVLLGGYGAWFLADGYRRNPVLRVVGELVRNDGLAQLAMGPGAVSRPAVSSAFSSSVRAETSSETLPTRVTGRNSARAATLAAEPRR